MATVEPSKDVGDGSTQTLCALYCKEDKSLDFYYSTYTGGTEDSVKGIYPGLNIMVSGNTFKGKKIANIYTNVGSSAYTLLTTPWYAIHNEIKTVNYNTTMAPTSNSLAHWFEGMNVTAINITKLDTSKITSFNSTFKLCPLLTTLNLSTWDTSKVTDTIEMFNGSELLKTVYVGDKWTMSGVTALKSANMFKACLAITGGNNTNHSLTHLDKTYACVDKTGTPGYFTYKLNGELRHPQDLPAQYTLLKYIESSGTQYIDSGVVFDQNTRVDSKWNITYSSSSAGVYGARYSSLNRSYSFWSINTTTLQSEYNTTAYNYSNYSNSTDVEISWNKNYRTVALSQQETFTYGTFTCPENAYIFAVNNNGTVSSNKTHAKLYYMQIYSDGKLTRDFVPVVNNQGDRGLYDFVTKTFFTNKGSGSFTGSEVDNSIDKTYYDMKYLKKQTARSYINTGIIPNNKTRLTAKFNNVDISQEQTLFGSRTASSSNSYTNKFLVLASASPKGLRTDWGAVSTNLSTSYNYPNKNIEIDKNKNLTYFNGTLVDTATDSTWTGTCQIYLLSLNNGSSGANVPGFKGSGIKILNCKIYDNETLVRDFTPMLHWSGMAGLYDKVNSAFYASSGPDDFIADKEIVINTGEFDCTHSAQKVSLEAGQYKLECWGAQGGTNSSYIGGYGGYSVGTITLSKKTDVYIYVGGAGSSSSTSQGFNGGGTGIINGRGGGGASDIRIGQDSLYARVIVAGGGGGAGVTSANANPAGCGGGSYGGDGYYNNTTGSYVTGNTRSGGSASQTAGGKAWSTSTTGTAGSFGIGGNASGYSCGGGGGGWYGGGGAYDNDSDSDGRWGGGGSGYVYTPSTASNYPTGCLLNSSYYLADASTATSTHTGDGFVKITSLSNLEKAPEILFELTEQKVKTGNILNYNYTGAVQSVTLPKGTYKLECWGAMGGYRSDVAKAGKGGYSVGTITLTAPTSVFIYVGGAGNTETSATNSIYPGGFNGGGYRYNYKGGGGASDIRIGEDSLYARVIVAGGGGSDGATGCSGGDAGGTAGSRGIFGCGSYGYGGGQTNSYTGLSAVASQLKTNSSSSCAAGFGFGGFGVYRSNGYGGAGGGGWYGGQGAYPDGSADDDGGGGGGSGYIYTSSTASNYPSGCLLNNSYYLTNASMIAGNASMASPTGSAETGHSGNGYVRITVIEAKTVPSFKVKINGEWKEASSAYIKVNGEWKEITDRYTKVNGAWKE